MKVFTLLSQGNELFAISFPNFFIFLIFLIFPNLILVTGGTGFIGHYLVNELLEAGYELRLLVRNPEGRNFPWEAMVELVEGDVLDVPSLEKAMEGVEYVIHAAAMVSFNKKQHARMKRINVQGTANVVNVALATGIKKLVHLSSTSATGRVGKGEWVDENSKWQGKEKHPQYGRSKRAAEMEVNRGVAEGLKAVMINPSIVLGTGDWTQNTPKIFTTLHKGLSFYGHGVGGYVAAKDVAKALRLAMESDFEQGERFILAAENLSQKAFFTKIATALDKKPPRYAFPRFLAPPLGWASEILANLRGKEPIITRETMRQVNQQTYFHGEKALQLGLTYTPIDEVIEETAKAFLEEREN
jgi:nucleoside-diphosphate-sugar epimerase